MANSIREVRNRIESTKKTSQITKAMNMVSASKLRKAEKSIKEFRPFIDKAKEIIENISSSNTEITHPIMTKREIKKTCYVVISSDRGLAGPFNSNILKELTKVLSNKNKNEYLVLALGTNAYSYCKKMNYPLINEKNIILKDEVEFNEISNITYKLVMSYLMKEIDCVTVIYNHYINTLNQEVKTDIILPLEKEKYQTTNLIEYEFDGGPEEILNTILPIYIQNYMYGLILDSKASEHASRMNSMKSATDNANEVINSLELLYNRARQSAITLELTDIVGGASVINQN